jgi:LAO/AO transport system kinase
MSALVKQALDSSRPALARLITLIENETPAGLEALDALAKHAGTAHIVGITGPSGSGKSSLVNRLAPILAARQPRETPNKVAIIAVDPSSPFSGGALLGDRVRMASLAADPGIFMRSMATRGALGGLARATYGAVEALDAAGFAWILIETVGAGQSEVEIARLAHTTLVLEAPGLGDDVQAAKAGILEIADILAVNKADQPGAEAAERALRAMLEIGHELRPPDPNAWQVPVLRVSALEGEGVDALADALQAHAEWLARTGGKAARDIARIDGLFDTALRAELWQDVIRNLPKGALERARRSAEERHVSPRQAARRLLARYHPGCPPK